MVKYRNVRVKKRGGGFRIQRARVLASGKLRFVKNPKTKRSNPSSSKKKTRKVKRRMARRKRRNRRKSFSIPLAPTLGLVAGLAKPIERAIQGRFVGNDSFVDIASHHYLGYIPSRNQLDWGGLKNGLLPLILGAVIHKFVGGHPLNVNRMLAAAGVPLIRI